MKFKKNIFKMFMAFVLCVSGLVGSSGVKAADTNIAGPNTLNMEIKKLNGNNYESANLASGLAISDLDKGKVSIEYQGGRNTTNNKLIITIPYYYSFDSAVDGKFYTIRELGSANGGKDNRIELDMVDSISDNANPLTVGFDFLIKVNQSSIDAVREEKWQNGTWNPNDEATEFIVEHNSNNPIKSQQNMLIEQKNYELDKNVFLAVETVPSIPYNTDVIKTRTAFSYGTDSYIFKDGGGVNDKTDSRNLVFAKVSYNYNNVYTYNPSGFKNLKIQLTVPAEFDFGDWKPSEFTAKVASAQTSSDKKTLTITLNDNVSSSDMFSRVLTGVEIKPAAEYQSGKKYYPSNVSYPVQMSVSSDGGVELAKQEKSITVKEYVDQDMLSVVPGGTLDETTNRTILHVADPGEVFEGSKVIKITNTRLFGAPDKEITSDGTDIKLVTNFDPNLRINKIFIKNQIANWQNNSYLSKNKWRSYSYTTNKQVVNDVPLGDDVTFQSITLNNKDEYITSVTINYDKFIYVFESEAIDSIFGQVSDRNLTDNVDWNRGDDIPISSTILDEDGKEISKGTNYIRIKDLTCPKFSMGDIKFNKALGIGEYANDEMVTSAALYLNSNYVGTPKYEDGTPSSKRAELLDTLENPIFTVGGTARSGGANEFTEAIVTNGKVNFAPIMGDGKWKAIIKTQSALGSKNNNPLKKYEISLPKFDTAKQLDLKTLANISDDEYIIWFSLQHEGDLDISSLSNHYTDANPDVGTAVDKMFFTVENTNFDKSPLTGEYNSYLNMIHQIHISYDNCNEIDGKHLPSKDGGWIDDGGYHSNQASYENKGAETLMLRYPSFNASVNLKQGATSTMNIKWNTQGETTSDEYKLLSKGGEDFYFRLSKDAQKYLSFERYAMVDGLRGDASIVELQGNTYLKITNPKRDQYEKQRLNTTGTTIKSVTFEPYDINIDIFSSTITPNTREVEIISQDSNSFVDYKGTSYQEYDLNGKTIRNAFSILNTYPLGTGVPKGNAWNKEGYNVQTNYLGIYDGSNILDRNYLGITPQRYSSTPILQAYQGVVLNPGINGNLSEANVQVYPWEKDKLTTSVTLIAGQSEAMKGLNSTIALPRKGVSVEDGGNTYTSEVSLYLTGPVQVEIGFGNTDSTKPIFKYSIDNGNTFVGEDKITDWSKVTHFSIDVVNIAVGDGSTFTIPMKTDDKDRSLGNAYMPALFSTTNLNSQSNRLNTYEFIGYEMSGTSWDDANIDGMIDAFEPKREAIMELYQDYGTDKETLIATTTSDSVSGNYEFVNLKEYERLTLVSNLPAKKTTTVLTDTTDNKFNSDGKGYAVHKFVKIDKNQHNIDYGIRDLIEVVIGGSDATTAITGKKTISGSLENSDIVKDQYTFNIVANANNPINGTENIPASISNDASTTAGANLSFTGMNGWTFTKEGIYKFTLNEVDPALKGHKFDQSVYEVTIVVTEKIENGVSSGKLQQTTIITKDGTNIAIDNINFENIANVYKVNYDTNGGEPSLIAPKTNVNWNDKNLLPTSNPTKIGHTFTGWEVKTTTKSASDVTNDDTYNALVQDDDTKNEITLKAKWTKNEYQVSWVSEDVDHGTLTPANASENVKYDEFATTDIAVTPNVVADEWAFTGWEYNYLPDGKADVPANYIKGVTQDYKSIEVKGNIVFTAKFAKKPFVNANSINGYVAIKNGTALPTIPDNVADKKTNAKIEYDESNTNAKSVAIAFENQRHHHLEKITISDLYGNSKIIYTNIKGETADTSFVMKDSTLNVDFSETGSLKVSNIKNSLNVHFTFKEDPKYNVNFYTQSKANVDDTTVPYASNEGLYSGDEYGAQPGVDPIKEGYTFSGWSTDGTNVNYKSTGKIKDDHVKVYAIWNEKSYAVKYNLNGGYYALATAIPDYMTSFNGANLLPNENPVKDGYAFDGWYYNGIKLTNAMKYKDLVADDTVDSITLSAKWTGNTYQVEFDKNSAKAKGNMALQEFTYGENKALSINEYARVGYTFAGWATSADGAVMYTDKQQVENLTEEQGGIVKLYAVWNANGDTMYKIEHYKQQDNGTWKTTPDDVANMSGKSDTEANAILKTETDAGYENYIFDVNNAKNIVKGSIEADGTLVLKVYYRQVLDVEFDINGGQTNIPSQRVVFGDSAKEPSNPIRDGYTFVGWFNTANNSTWNFDDAVESNMVLKAQWEKIEVPATPDKPGTNTTPDTGDTTNAKALLGLLGSSMFVLAVMWRRRKKQEIKNL